MAPLTDAGEEPYGPERWEEHVATKHPVVPHVSNDSDNDSQDAQVQRNQHATAAKLLRGIDKSLSATSSEVHRGCDDIVQALRQERRRKQLQKPEKRKFMAEYFTWLEIPEQNSLDSSYTPFLDLPCSSFDFGWNGISATCNAGGELLQLTTPSSFCGFLSVKGDFPDSPDSLLARAQRYSVGKASFGLKVEDPPDSGCDRYCRLGQLTARGCFNYRWPMNRYDLKRGQDVVGSCSIFSCVKGRKASLYQIMRLHMSAPKSTETENASSAQVLVTAGGRMRFGCLCGGLRPKAYMVEWDPVDQARHLKLHGENELSGYSLSMKLYVDGKSQHMDTEDDRESPLPSVVLSKASKDEPGPPKVTPESQCGDTEFKVDITLYPNVPVIVVLKYRFEKDPKGTEAEPRRDDQYLHEGISKAFHSLAGLTIQPEPDFAGNFSMMWRQIYGRPATSHTKTSRAELLMVARCLERILSVNYIQNKVRKSTYVSMFSSPICSRARLTYQEIFWKMRFMIKAYDAVCPRSIETKDLVGLTRGAFDKMAKQTQARIQVQLSYILKSLMHCLDGEETVVTSSRFEVPTQRLRRSSTFTANENETSQISDVVEPSLPRLKTKSRELLKPLEPDKRRPPRPATTMRGSVAIHIPQANKQWDRDTMNSYHILPSFWYVIRNHHDLLYEGFRDDLLERISKFVTTLQDVDSACRDSLKSAILQWYHYDCAIKIIIWLMSKAELRFRTPQYDPNESAIDDTQQEAITPDSEESKRLGEKTELLVELLDEMELYKAAATRAIVLRTASRSPYTASDEECDRLLSVAGELAISDHAACIRHAKMRIKSRAKTSMVNSGDVPSEYHSIFRVPKFSPWELHALCHHSRLLIRDELENDKNAETMKRCLEFLSAEATVIPTWQRSTTESLTGWFGIEATCVIASTVLDIALERRNGRGSERVPENGDGMTQTAAGTQTDADTIVYRRPEPSFSSIRHGHKSSLASLPETPESRIQKFQGLAPLAEDTKTDSEMDSLDAPNEGWPAVSEKLSDILDAVRQMTTGEFFNWKAYQPGKRYHPDSFYNSVDDSPNLYTLSRIKTIEPRQTLREYLSQDWVCGQPPQWAMTDSKRYLKHLLNIPPDQTRYLSVIDIKHPSFFQDSARSVDDNPIIVGRLEYETALREIQRNMTAGSGNSGTTLFNSLTRGNSDKDHVALLFYTALIDGSLTRREDFARLPMHLKQRFAQLPLYWRACVGESDVSELRVRLRKKVIETLCDSMVDKQVQFRILFLQRCSRPLVRGFVYMWHPEALDMFDRHLGNLCHFSSQSNQSCWVISITILYWSLKPRPADVSGATSNISDQCEAILEQIESSKWTRGASPMSDVFDENRDIAIFPPDFLGHNVYKKAGRISNVDDLSTRRYIKGEHCVEERATSILITTNGLGDLGRCSVVSPVISEEAMLESSRFATEVWKAFINQPQTARCLIVLILLGATCDALSNQYQDILETLNNVSLGLNTGMRRSHGLQDTFTWTNSDDVIVKLRRSLWTLTVLQVFVATMKEALQRISEAKTEMKAQINGGPGRRHDVLEQMCQGYVEEFDKKYVRFEAMAVKYDHSIDHITRFRDGISNISTLEDGRTALRQDRNIWILTWITIMYLPISLTTAVFAIPDEQKVLRPGLKLTWYLTIIGILSVFTVSLAFGMLRWVTVAAGLNYIWMRLAQLWRAKGERARLGFV